MLFTVDIDEEWFDTLDSLIQMTLGSSKAGILRGSVATPEEALTVIIFFQFKLQRLKLAPSCKDRKVVMFPYDPEPQELADYWDSFEDGPPCSCLDGEIEEHLVPRCTSCGAEAQEWDTACFECGGPVG